MEDKQKNQVGLALNIVLGFVSYTTLQDADFRLLGVKDEYRAQMSSEKLIKRATDIVLKAIVGDKLPEVIEDPKPEESESKEARPNRYDDRIYRDTVAEGNDKAQVKKEVTPSDDGAVSSSYVDQDVADRWGIQTGETLDQKNAELNERNISPEPGTTQSEGTTPVTPDPSVLNKEAGTVESKSVVTGKKAK